MKGEVAMYPEQIFSLLMLIVAVLVAAIIVSTVRSYWHKLLTDPRLASGDVSPSWFRPLVRS
jgi:uncharacterized membrane protein (DUF106 family)